MWLETKKREDQGGNMTDDVCMLEPFEAFDAVFVLFWFIFYKLHYPSR